MERPNDAVQFGGNGLSLLILNPFITSVFSSEISQGMGVSYINYYQFSELNESNVIFSNKNKYINTYFQLRVLSSGLMDNYDFLFAVNKSYQEYSFGFLFKYNLEKIENYDSNGFFICNFSSSFKNDYFKLAFSLNNITGTNLDEVEFPITFILENNIKIDNKCSFSFGLEKESNFDFSYKTGIVYNFFSSLDVIFSHQWNPNRFGASFSFNYKKCTINYGVRTHKYLDLSHALSLSFNY